LNDTPTEAARPTGATLRTYRLAVACTGEYATAAGGGTVLGALGAIVTTVNRVSAVYERDFAIRLRLIANEEQLIFTDPVTDGFTNNSANSLINSINNGNRQNLFIKQSRQVIHPDNNLVHIVAVIIQRNFKICA